MTKRQKASTARSHEGSCPSPIVPDPKPSFGIVALRLRLRLRGDTLWLCQDLDLRCSKILLGPHPEQNVLLLPYVTNMRKELATGKVYRKKEAQESPHHADITSRTLLGCC